MYLELIERTREEAALVISLVNDGRLLPRPIVTVTEVDERAMMPFDEEPTWEDAAWQ